MLAILIYWIVRFFQNPGWDNGELVILGVALILLMFIARLFALRVQDRLVRLEERLRYDRVLDPETAAKAGELSVSQMVALRFASDEELSELVLRTLNGEFESQKDIQLAVKNWRPDYLRV